MPARRLLAPCLSLALLLSLALARPAAAAAAGETLRQALAPFGPDLVTTGRLLDRALPLSGVRDLDGRPDAPALTPARLRGVLDELDRAALAPGSWPSPAMLRARATAPAADPAPLEIAVVDLAYQTLRPDALDRGLLLYSTATQTLEPRPDATTADLLHTRRAVAAATLRQATFHGARARFVVPRDLLFVDGPVTLRIDLADGAGLRPIQPDRPLVARYAATGRKEIRLQLVAADGATRWTRFLLDVVALDTPPPSAVWPLQASIAFDGVAATGEAFVYLADGHAEVTRPVVVVEGFDLDDSYNWPELYALLNQENLLEDLRAAGRDAVVLNFASATDLIQRNAFLLVELLQTLDAQLPPTATYPVVGASMGGLVARRALAWLESAGGGHRCDLFVSFDVPHLGANIPLGLQCWVDFFAGDSGEAAYLLSRLATPAARQMLLYHHTALSGTTAAPDPLLPALQDDLAALGDWPAQPRRVALVNGSGSAVGQGFAPGAQLILYEYESFLVDIIGNVWAVPDGNSQVVFRGLIDLVWPFPDSQRTVTVAGTSPWDGAPGGHRNSLAQLGDTQVEYGDIVALHDNHAFIPTTSALVIDGAPFDAVFVPAVNEEHVAVTPASREWLLAELLGAATAAPAAPVPVAAAPRLGAASPNPFNPRTEITFVLPQAGPASLWIADARGRHVARLVAGDLAAGSHVVAWEGRDQQGRGLASGVYLAVLEHGGHRLATRLTLVR